MSSTVENIALLLLEVGVMSSYGTAN